MQDAARSFVDALDVRPTHMGEPEPPAGVRNANLTSMEMAGEDEVEDARLKEVDHLREVAEENAQIGLRVGQALRLRATQTTGARIDAGDLDLPPAQLDRLRVVHEEPGRRQVGKLDGAREGIARDGQVVVAEHGVAAREPLD